MSRKGVLQQLITGGKHLIASLNIPATEAALVSPGSQVCYRAGSLVYCRVPILRVFSGDDSFGTLLPHYNGEDDDMMRRIRETFPDIDDKGIRTELIGMASGSSIFKGGDEQDEGFKGGDMRQMLGEFLSKDLRCINPDSIIDFERHSDKTTSEAVKRCGLISRLRSSLVGTSIDKSTAIFSFTEGGVQFLTLPEPLFNKFALEDAMVLPCSSAILTRPEKPMDVAITSSDKDEKAGKSFVERIEEERIKRERGDKDGGMGSK